MSPKKQTIGIRELAEKAKADDAYDLAQGVIDAPPPEVLINSLSKLPIGSISGYDNKRGVLPYREAVKKYLATRGWNLSVKQVLGTTGATGGMVGALLTDCRPGDKVLLPEPFFVGHKFMLEALGFDIGYYKVPMDKQPDWEEIKQKMKSVKALILTTPANPTGQVASQKILKDLSEAAKDNNCLLIIDEMYREFIWNEETTNDSGYEKINLDKTVIVRSFSKTFAIPGWRVGFAVTSPERIEKMATHHDALYIGGSTIAQHAIAHTLTKNLKDLNQYVKDLRQLLQRNLAILTKAFQSNNFDPLPVPATYYLLLKHNRKSDTAAMEELCAKKIVTTPANIFFKNSDKDTGYIRAHFAVTQDTAKKVSKILTSH